jgi:hypothetical protein
MLERNYDAIRTALLDLDIDLPAQQTPYLSIDSDRIQRYLEAAIETPADPPLSLTAIAKYLGHDPSTLRSLFPRLCEEIQRIYRDHKEAECNNWRAILQYELAKQSFPPPSLYEICNQYGLEKGRVYPCAEDLCKALVARHTAYRSLHTDLRLKEIRTVVRDAVRTLHADGQIPTPQLVCELLNHTRFDHRDLDFRHAYDRAVEELRDE